jgi:hypothetical protein
LVIVAILAAFLIVPFLAALVFVPFLAAFLIVPFLVAFLVILILDRHMVVVSGLGFGKYEKLWWAQAQLQKIWRLWRVMI